MSTEAKWIVVVCVLAITLPLVATVLRRLAKGQPFEDKGTILPPSGPSINIDGT